MLHPAVTPPDRILVVKLASLGDLLTITPALRAIRTTWPRAHVAVLATPTSSPVLTGLDTLDEVIPFDKFAFDKPSAGARDLGTAISFGKTLRRGRWDTLFLFHHFTTRFGTLKYAALAFASGARTRVGLDNGRGRWVLTHRVPDGGFGARHEADYWIEVAARLGARRCAEPLLEIAPSTADRVWASHQWQRLGRRPSALISPGSGAFSIARRWDAGRFADVARQMPALHGLRPVVLSGLEAGEKHLAQRVASLAGSPAVLLPAAPSPSALAAFIADCRVVIANDSGPVHLAAAVGTPVVAIFGPTNERAWGPYPVRLERNQVVRQQVACAPCIHRGHELGTPQGCAARTCLDLITPHHVLAAVARALTAATMSRTNAQTA